MTDPTVRDQIISRARSLPELINTASVLDPQMARQLTGEATESSKTPIGAFLAWGAAMASTRYGLHWDEGTCHLIAGGACLIGGYLTHWWNARHAGLMSSAEAAKAVKGTQ